MKAYSISANNNSALHGQRILAESYADAIQVAYDHGAKEGDYDYIMPVPDEGSWWLSKSSHNGHVEVTKDIGKATKQRQHRARLPGTENRAFGGIFISVTDPSKLEVDFPHNKRIGVYPNTPEGQVNAIAAYDKHYDARERARQAGEPVGRAAVGQQSGTAKQG